MIDLTYFITLLIAYEIGPRRYVISEVLLYYGTCRHPQRPQNCVVNFQVGSERSSTRNSAAITSASHYRVDISQPRTAIHHHYIHITCAVIRKVSLSQHCCRRHKNCWAYFGAGTRSAHLRRSNHGNDFRVKKRVPSHWAI